MKESHIEIFSYNADDIQKWKEFQQIEVANDEQQDEIVEYLISRFGVCPLSVKLEEDVLILAFKTVKGVIVNGAT